jgi:hypothetical protein
MGLNKISLKNIKSTLLSEPYRTIILLPEIFLLLFLFNDQIYLDNVVWLSVLVSSFLIYVLTSSDFFNHLGESYRYLEYNLFFIVPFILGIIVYQQQTIYVLYVMYVLLLSMLFYKLNSKRKYPEVDKLNLFLSNIHLKKNDVIFPISMRLGADIVARRDVKTFWWQPGGLTSLDVWDKYIKEYPYLRNDWQNIFDEFNVRYVVADKNALNSIIDNKRNWRYDFSKLDLIFEDDTYLAYKVV